MKRRVLLASACLLSLTGSFASAQHPAAALAQSTAPATTAPVAGEVPLGVTVIEMRAVVAGWSVKKDLLGKSVQNDKKENLGKIEDLIISPRTSASVAIVGVGGFLGIPARLVAIPMNQIKLQGTQLVLPGATKDALKAMPPFVYSH
jgi:sporulation protein YlmC with PRC-barrel domain